MENTEDFHCTGNVLFLKLQGRYASTYCSIITFSVLNISYYFFSFYKCEQGKHLEWTIIDLGKGGLDQDGETVVERNGESGLSKLLTEPLNKTGYSEGLGLQPRSRAQSGATQFKVLSI